MVLLSSVNNLTCLFKTHCVHAYVYVAGGGGVAFQQNPLWHFRHIGRHDVHGEHS